MRNIKALKLLNYVLAFIAVVLLVFVFSKLNSAYDEYKTRKAIHSVYNEKAKALIPNALQNLQAHQNDWLICTDLGLSLYNINNPNTMAAWVVYYQYGKEYCKQWWDWPKSPCQVMKSQLSNVDDRKSLVKKITLCELAEKRAKEKK